MNKIILVKETINLLLKTFKTTIKEIYFQNKIMSIEEAQQILNVQRNTKDLKKIYERMFALNSIENKGSPYLQSKISTAYRILQKENEKQKYID